LPLNPGGWLLVLRNRIHIVNRLWVQTGVGCNAARSVSHRVTTGNIPTRNLA